jgi:diguanylate cyclase (GGDEF)-like protein
MNKLIRIGDFSKNANISNRMLRHYDKIELLKPVHIEDSGYRFYTEDQYEEVQTIQVLQSFGYTLSEIKFFFDHDVSKEEFIESLKDKETKFRLDIDEQMGHLIKIQRFLDQLHSKSISSNQLLDLKKLKLDGGYKMENVVTLNDLPQTSLFYERIEEEVKNMSGTKFFISFDIDKFASINDEYGFDIGDKVIKVFYEAIYNHIVLPLNVKYYTRLGGDEFGLVVTEVTKEELSSCLDEVLKTVEMIDTVKFGMNKVFTASAGIYEFETYENVHELYHACTKGMIQAKRNGRNQYSFIKQ